MAFVTNARQTAAALDARGRRLIVELEANLRTETALCETRTKARASGRPGPRVQTGDYRRSITRRVYRDGDSLIGEVGTNKPQARRLEYGFVGADSLGRVYNQPPYPHFGPAAKETEISWRARNQSTIRRLT